MAQRLEMRRFPQIGANTSLPDNNPLDTSRTHSVVQPLGEHLTPASEGPASQPLFEQEVHVQMKLMEREEICQPLQISIATGRSGPHHLTRCVTARLTDPRDPFFLFVMTLLEDEYGRFKEEHELNVDFAGFPRYLVSFLQSCVDGHHFTVTFVVQDHGRGTLRILERTEFRPVEHLKLQLLRQGDDGQKRYLAERFQFFQSAYMRTESDRQKQQLASQQLIDELRRDVDLLTAERDEARQQLKVEASAQQTTRIGELAALKEKFAAELNDARQQFEAEKRNIKESLTATIHEEESRRRELQAQLGAVSSRLETTLLESSQLSERYGRVTESEARLKRQLDDAASTIADLTTFKKNATQKLTETDLQSVSSSERLRHYSENLRAKDDEVKTLREQARQQEGYARVLTEQLEASQTKQKELEANLTKAHHIIKTLLSNQEVGKQKSSAVHAQLQAREESIREKETALERLRADLVAAQDRVQALVANEIRLKEQLAKSDDDLRKTRDALETNQQALITLNRQPFGARRFGSGTAASIVTSTGPVVPTGLGVAQSLGATVTPPMNVHRAFYQGQYHQPTASAGRTPGSQPASFSTSAATVAGNDSERLNSLPHTSAVTGAALTGFSGSKDGFVKSAVAGSLVYPQQEASSAYFPG